MRLNLQHFSIEHFLSHYWQQRPVLIKQGLPQFTDIISADELAGLAMEEEVESRLIQHKGGQWSAQSGPFEDYSHLGEENWTLVVQAVNHWITQAEKLSHCFDFIPRWRFDDVMTSYAVKGGSVGPHIDNYDVFICQGSGRRRWRVGDKGNYQQFSAHKALLHTEPFEAIIDEVLEAGDILYLPPGFPHDGISLEPSMSFSVGYRTASAKDMFSGFADYLIDADLGEKQITDPKRAHSQHQGIVNSSDFNLIKTQLFEQLTDDHIANFSGCFLTQSKCELDVNENMLLDIGLDEWLPQLQQQALLRLSGLKILYFDVNYQQGVFYLNGEQQNLPLDCVGFIPLLCDNQNIDIEMFTPWLNSKPLLELMTQWIQKGYWYFDCDND